MQQSFFWFRRLLPLLLPALILGAIAWYQRPDGRLHIIFLPTAGDAVLIQTPHGSFILIDGGSDPATLATLMSRRMPFWQRELAAVVLTTPRGNWLAGQVAALTRYRARVALAPPMRGKNPLTAEWWRLLSDAGSSLRIAHAGSRLVIDGVTLTVIDPGSDEAGVAVELEYGRVRVLFDGAASEDDDSRLAELSGPFQAVLLPWQRALPERLLMRLKPRILVFSDALQVKKPVELTTWDRAFAGAAVYHEEINGTIELTSDGMRLQLQTER